MFGEFFRRIFFEGFSLEEFFGRNFWEDFFGRISFEEFNQKLIRIRCFCQDFEVILSQWRRRKKNFNP